MRFRQLGRSGLVVSEVGLGANNFGGRLDERESLAVIEAALDAGINLVDTADIYNAGRSEEIVGRAIVSRRDDVVVATKVGLACEEGEHGGGLSSRHVRRIVHRSMRRMQVDRIDLLQLHIRDPWTPIEETCDALDRLVRSGDVLYVGSTNFWAWEIAEWVTFASAQGLPALVGASSEWSLLHREPERELLSAAAHLGVGLLPYRPLAQGFLTGKYSRDTTPAAGSRFDLVPHQARQRLSDENFDLLDAVGEFAAARDLSLPEVAFAYLLHHSEVSSVLVGASSAEQVVANARWSAATLDEESMTSLGEILGDIEGHWLGLPQLRPLEPRRRPRP